MLTRSQTLMIQDKVAPLMYRGVDGRWDMVFMESAAWREMGRPQSLIVTIEPAP